MNTNQATEGNPVAKPGAGKNNFPSGMVRDGIGAGTQWCKGNPAEG